MHAGRSPQRVLPSLNARGRGLCRQQPLRSERHGWFFGIGEARVLIDGIDLLGICVSRSCRDPRHHSRHHSRRFSCITESKERESVSDSQHIMVSVRSRATSRAGTSRFPVDAEGQHGIKIPRRKVEPEVEIDGKVVLFGKPVTTVADEPPHSPEGDFLPASRQSLESTRSKQDSGEREGASELSDGSSKPPELELSSGCAWDLFASTDNAKASEDQSGVFNWFGGTCMNDNNSENSHRQEHNKSDMNDRKSNEEKASIADSTVSPPLPKEKSEWGAMMGWQSQSTEAGPNEVDKKDDESTVDGRLFGELSSLPSVQGDVTIDGNSIHSTDFEGRDNHSNEQAGRVEEKVHEIIVNTNTPQPIEHERSSVMYRRRSGAEELSSNNRRQILIKELRTAIATYGRYDMRCANVSAALGDLLNETEEHEQAVKLHRDAVSIYSVKLGDDHSTTISAKFRLATVLADAKEYDDAISTYYSVIAMRRALKGDKDPSVAEGLALMANCLKRNGEYHQAIKELKRALKIYRESLGDSHDHVSRTVDEIASLYVTLGDFEKSAAILEEVVKLKAATQGLQSKAVAETLLSLAMTYECSEQFPQAMKSLKKAYKIYTEIDGYSSEDSTATLKKIALLYEATGDYNRASIAFLGVLRGQKIHLGEDSLQVGETYCKLGHALRQTGQLEKALKCMKEALPIFVGKGVEMHDVERIAEIMHEMALIYKEKRHFNEAARIFKQELSVRRKIGQPEYPCIARTLNLLGVTEYEMRNNSRALKFLVESLTIYQQERHGRGIECAEVLFNTGLVFNAVRNSNRALEAFTESLRIFRDKNLAEEDPRVQQTEQEIAKLRQVTNTRHAR